MVMPSSMNEILVSLSRKGGVRDLPGDKEGDAKGVVRRPDLRMDWGVNSANPGEVTDIAKVLAFYDKEQMEFTISVCKRHLHKDRQGQASHNGGYILISNKNINKKLYYTLLEIQNSTQGFLYIRL